MRPDCLSQSAQRRTQVVSIKSLEHIIAGLDGLEQELARTAVERDRRGGHAAEQKELLRQHGLLLLSVPREYGGVGAAGRKFSTSCGALPVSTAPWPICWHFKPCRFRV